MAGRMNGEEMKRLDRGIQETRRKERKSLKVIFGALSFRQMFPVLVEGTDKFLIVCR